MAIGEKNFRKNLGKMMLVGGELLRQGVIKDLGEDLSIHRLMVQQILGGDFQFPAAAGEDLFAPGICGINQRADLLVNNGGHLLGVGLGLGHGAADKHLVMPALEYVLRITILRAMEEAL